MYKGKVVHNRALKNEKMARLFVSWNAPIGTDSKNRTVPSSDREDEENTFSLAVKSF